MTNAETLHESINLVNKLLAGDLCGTKPCRYVIKHGQIAWLSEDQQAIYPAIQRRK